MERIEALVFDIDRTLLAIGQPPSPQTVAAVERCRATGIPCLVATARSQNSARKTLGPLSWLAESGVFQNGAVGSCASSGFLAVEDMAASVIAEAIAVYRSGCRTRGIPADGLAADGNVGHLAGIQASIHTGDNRPAFARAIARETLGLWGYDPTQLREFVAASREPSCRIMLWSEDATDLKWLADGLSEALASRACVHYFDSGTSISITALGCDKGSMTLRLLAHRGIDAASTAAFGDDVTDVPLLKAVGHGVAMGDGHPLARAAARWRTGSAHEDGVAAMLARMQPMLAPRSVT